MLYVITFIAGLLSGVALLVGVAYFSLKKKKKQALETISKISKERRNM